MNFEKFKDAFQKVPIEHFQHSAAKNPIVSVLVQTYNHEKYIGKCLDSILNQKTNFDFEILVGEDCSSDSTREICVEYAKKFPEKIRLFLHKKNNKIKVNGIATGNFNAFYNFYNAKGKYIAFCEGDDYWVDPLKLQKQIDFLLDEKEYVLCYHDYHFINEYSSRLDDAKFPSKHLFDISSRDMREVNYHPLLSTACFRKEFKTLPPQIMNIINVDTFIISLLGSYGSGKFLSHIEPSYYRIHNGGVWSKEKKSIKFLNKITTYKKLKEYYSSIGDLKTSSTFLVKFNGYRKMALVSYLKEGKILSILNLIKS